MEFGVFILAQQRGYHQSPEQVLKNSVEQSVVAEQAGFNTAWFAEHHFNNYSLSPSPLMMVAHCAALTKRIRLGTAVCVLPLYHPLRFLAEVGFADLVSDGRLELGIGSGYQKFEFDRFGVNIEETSSIFHEFLDVLNLGLKERVFEYHGKHLDILPTSISLRVKQQPMPPIWLASGHPATLGRGMRERHNLFVTAYLNGAEALRSLRSKLEQVAESEKCDIREASFGLLRCAYASDNDAEIQSYVENALYQRRISESLKFRRAQSDDGYMVKEVPGPNDLTPDQIRANVPVGSVSRVVDRLLEEISIVKPRHIAIQTQLGDFDQKTMLRQIELWGEKIIPEVRRHLGRGQSSKLAMAGA